MSGLNFGAECTQVGGVNAAQIQYLTQSQIAAADGDERHWSDGGAVRTAFGDTGRRLYLVLRYGRGAGDDGSANCRDHTGCSAGFVDNALGYFGQRGDLGLYEREVNTFSADQMNAIGWIDYLTPTTIAGLNISQIAPLSTYGMNRLRSTQVAVMTDARSKC